MSDDGGSKAGDDDADDYGLSKDKLIKQKVKKAPAKPRAKPKKEED